MAQWHVIKANPDSLEVMVHFLVPAGNNTVGVSWKDAALKAGLTGAAPSVWVTDPAEAASIAAGEIVELQITVPLPKHWAETIAAQKVLVQTAVTKAIVEAKALWAGELKLTGYSEGTVV